MATLFDKYPQLRALADLKLFLSGHLAGFYGIIWNDDLDIETKTIYECCTYENNLTHPTFIKSQMTSFVLTHLQTWDILVLKGADRYVYKYDSS